MRRRAGVGAIQKKTLEQGKYRDKGYEIQENQLEQLTKQMEQFSVNLEDFAKKHRKDIKQDAQFRRQFQSMCAAIGVDPLSSSKGFWSVLGMGDFYYELAVKIIEICLATTPKNGGLIGLDDLRTRLIQQRRGHNLEYQEVTADDLRVAVKKLRILEGGFSIVEVGKGRFFVQSVPVELSMDHTMVLNAAEARKTAFVTSSILQSELQWLPQRAEKALDFLVEAGLAWIDKQGSETSYWFPSMFEDCILSQ